MSIYLFSKKNIIRRFFHRVVKHDKFETVVLIVIIFSSLKLIVDTYLNAAAVSKTVTTVDTDLDIIITVFFCLELMSKVISDGFIMDDGSYLREGWSWLDLIIVIVSVFDLVVTSVNLSAVKVIRLMRALRPLRFVRHNKNLKLLVTALTESTGDLLNLGIIIIFIYLMFGIFAVSTMMNRFWSCNLPSSYPYENFEINKANVKYFLFHKKK
jgi:hypothetical protein